MWAVLVAHLCLNLVQTDDKKHQEENKYITYRHFYSNKHNFNDNLDASDNVIQPK